MIKKLPAKYKKLVDQYQPIQFDDMVLFPIKVKHYEEYLVASEAVGYATQKLPLDLIGIPILSAFYKMDYQKAVEGETPTGLFTSAVLALALALRLADEESDITKLCQRFKILTSPDDPSVLKALKVTVNGEEEKVITPVQFTRMRPIIASQNGITIPDENENPEIMESEQILAEKNSIDIEVDPSNLIASASALTGKDETEIYEWAILKLHTRLASFKRIIDYIICGIGESQGTKWKGGNPTPHPWFGKKKKMSDALIPLERFAGGEGLKAFEEYNASANE